MSIDPMFWLATAAFAWGLSLASYRWFATYNGWPMGEWQAHRPGLPIAIGLLAVLFAVFFALARGGETVLVLPLFGLICALGWTALTRVAAQSALILAPLAVLALLGLWLSLASHLPTPVNYGASAVAPPTTTVMPNANDPAYPAATDREGRIDDRDRGITFGKPQR
ncbi:MAG: hypothetical protein R3D67_16120 [Hyphomicrobiaceae bacterium]